jgi:hypothetical protein
MIQKMIKAGFLAAVYGCTEPGRNVPVIPDSLTAEKMFEKGIALHKADPKTGRCYAETAYRDLQDKDGEWVIKMDRYDEPCAANLLKSSQP